MKSIGKRAGEYVARRQAKRFARPATATMDEWHRGFDNGLRVGWKDGFVAALRSTRRNPKPRPTTKRSRK